MRRRQQPYIDQIKGGAEYGVMEIPVYYTNHLSIGDIGDMAGRILKEMGGIQNSET